MVVEVQFHLLKQPALASVIFLKTPSRIDALVMHFFTMFRRQIGI